MAVFYLSLSPLSHKTGKEFLSTSVYEIPTSLLKILIALSSRMGTGSHMICADEGTAGLRSPGGNQSVELRDLEMEFSTM